MGNCEIQEEEIKCKPKRETKIELKCEGDALIWVNECRSEQPLLESSEDVCDSAATHLGFCQLTEMTEQLRTSCNMKSSCSIREECPTKDECKFGEDEKIHIHVVYECHTKMDEKFDPMASTGTVEGHSMTLESAGYPELTDTITECTCDIRTQYGFSIKVYDLHSKGGFKRMLSPPFCISLTSGDGFNELTECETTGEPCKKVHPNKATLKFLVNTAEPFQGQFKINLRGSKSGKVVVDCSQYETTTRSAATTTTTTTTTTTKKPAQKTTTSPINSPTTKMTTASETTGQVTSENASGPSLTTANSSQLIFNAGPNLVTVGIVAGGVLAGVLIVGTLAAVFVFHHKSKKKTEPAQEDTCHVPDILEPSSIQSTSDGGQSFKSLQPDVIVAQPTTDKSAPAATYVNASKSGGVTANCDNVLPPSDGEYVNHQAIHDHEIAQLYAIPQKRLTGGVELAENDLYEQACNGSLSLQSEDKLSLPKDK